MPTPRACCGGPGVLRWAEPDTGGPPPSPAERATPCHRLERAPPATQAKFAVAAASRAAGASPRLRLALKLTCAWRQNRAKARENRAKQPNSLLDAS